LSGCSRDRDEQGPPRDIRRAWQPVGATRPTAESIEVRRVGDRYEVEVQRPEGFPGRDFEPVLSIGDASFGQYRASPTVGGHYGLVYALSDAQFASLVDGGQIVVHYGPNKNRGWTFGYFQRSSVRQ